MIYRAAVEADAPAMGRMMVDTYMHAHKDHMPEEAWLKRKQEWTPEVSGNAFARDIRSIADGSDSLSCIYIAVDKIAVDKDRDEIIGLVVGGPGEAEPWPNVAEIYSLYVRSHSQRRGVGRRLLQMAVAQLAQLGMTSLIIKCVTANVSASRFYAAMGGQVIGTTEFDEEGYKLPELIFGWEDISAFPTG